MDQHVARLQNIFSFASAGRTAAIVGNAMTAPVAGHNLDNPGDQQMLAQPWIAVVALAVSGALLSGCDKKAGPESTQSGLPKEVVTTPAPPSPPPPDANAKSTQSPPPGQANDHSNPEFKGGGLPDKSGKSAAK